MITLTAFLLLLGLVLAVALTIVAVLRRSLEWGLLGALLACWLLAQLLQAGLRIA